MVGDRNDFDTNQYQKLRDSYEARLAYHTLKSSTGLTLKGRYDMSKFLDYYKIPDDLSDCTVLDIGPANGYFSFEFFRRGAKKVVAIDKYSDRFREELNQFMSTDVNFIVQDITTLDESFEKFDIVFCSNVLQHSSDIFGNIERIKKVTKRKAILCTQLIKNISMHDVPLARFYGNIIKDVKGRDFSTYWIPNMNCFKYMAKAAGFSKVDKISTFDLESEDKTRKTLEGVIHCFI